ncbi:borealin [Copidosoma floridanum]|uniref:borealin n=1 Tax=Copidosoma floridanum TaxID=29053 RepID=UPI0006C98A54|nr:borealin [Copidosoma floridanum]
MPRTKQRRAGRGNGTDIEEVIRNCNRLIQLKIHQLEVEHKSRQEKFDMMIEMALNRFPTEIQTMTLDELMTFEPSPQKENLHPKTPGTVAKSSSRLPKSTVKRNGTKRTTVTSDDGYQSEPMTNGQSKLGPSEAKKQRRSRSTQSRDKLTKPSIRTPSQSKRQLDMLKTPQNKPTNSFTITPKIKFNSAVNVLRRPKNGEMVFSTQGSPLLVSTTVSERTANVNVPLRNGDIVSLLPFNASLSENLVLDEETRHQLKVLKSHLEKVINE